MLILRMAYPILILQTFTITYESYKNRASERVYALVILKRNRLKTVIAQRNHGSACTVLYVHGSPTNIRFVDKTLSVDCGNILLSVGGCLQTIVIGNE